jgi:hypothetical protein
MYLKQEFPVIIVKYFCVVHVSIYFTTLYINRIVFRMHSKLKLLPLSVISAYFGSYTTTGTDADDGY